MNKVPNPKQHAERPSILPTGTAAGLVQQTNINTNPANRPDPPVTAAATAVTHHIASGRSLATEVGDAYGFSALSSIPRDSTRSQMGGVPEEVMR